MFKVILFRFFSRLLYRGEGSSTRIIALNRGTKTTDFVCDSDRSVTEGAEILAKNPSTIQCRSIICNVGQHQDLILISLKHQFRNGKRTRKSQRSSIAQIRIGNIESATAHRIRPFVHTPSPSQVICA